MLSKIQQTIVILTICLSITSSKILRNKALISRMVSNFHNDISDNEVLEPVKEKPETVLTKMQNVLCKNFPSIPCDVITKDNTLRKLIERSIKEINNKKTLPDKTTPHPAYLTLFPIINSEDLSNFLQVRDDSLRNSRKNKTLKTKKNSTSKQKSGREKRINKNKGKRTLHGRKKIRKFYPHKVKYKDKVASSVRDDFGDHSEERLSMSVEVPDMTKKHQHFAYKMEPAEPPVWRIDYMKHSAPNIDMFAFNGIKRNLKTGPNVILKDTDHTVRKDILHPDVYIKSNYVRRNSVVSEDNSEIVD